MGLGWFTLFLAFIFLFISFDAYEDDGFGVSTIIFFAGTAFFATFGALILKTTSEEKNEKELINNPKRIKKSFDDYFSKNFGNISISTDDIVHLHTARKSYIFKPENDLFIFIDYRPKYDKTEKKVVDEFNSVKVDLKHIRKLALKTDNITIGEVTKGNAVGRAIVGGALFGAAGAIVGSTSAKETQIQSSRTTSIEMEIVTDDLKNPYSTISLYDSFDESTTYFTKMEQVINNMYWSLENYISQAQENKNMD